AIAHGVEVTNHSVGRDLRYEDADVTAEAAQGGPVEMVPVQVRDVDRVGPKAANQIWRWLGQVPPAAPIACSEEPAADQDRAAVALDVHTRMTDNREFHRDNSSCIYP